jgi:hypothetical protein
MRTNTFKLKFRIEKEQTATFYVRIFYTKKPATILYEYAMFSTLPEVEHAWQILRIILFNNPTENYTRIQKSRRLTEYNIENRILIQKSRHLAQYKNAIIEKNRAIIISNKTSICLIKKVAE